MTQHAHERFEYYRPNIEYTDKITIEIHDIESKDIPQAIFAASDALKMPQLNFNPMAMPQLPNFQVPQISLPQPQEVPRVEHEDCPRNHVPRNGQRKSHGQ